MKLTKKLSELINSGITLTDTEAALVEDYIQSKSTPVKPKHLNEWRAMAAARGMGSDKQG